MKLLCRFIGHRMTIFESYETYAVCFRCGYHDWSSPKDLETIMEYFIKKYPKAKVVPFDFD